MRRLKGDGYCYILLIYTYYNSAVAIQCQYILVSVLVTAADSIEKQLSLLSTIVATIFVVISGLLHLPEFPEVSYDVTTAFVLLETLKNVVALIPLLAFAFPVLPPFVLYPAAADDAGATDCMYDFS